MATPSATEIAALLADLLDGDFDDGLEAFVAAMANGNGLHIDLSDEFGERFATYRVIVEQI